VARPEQLWWAVLRTRVIDELTERPPLRGVRISSTTPHCLPRVAHDGVCGLAAHPRDVSSALVRPGALSAEVGAPGYLARSLDAAIDAARRRLPFGAALGTTSLSVQPIEAQPREQFVPGRGVTIGRELPGEPEQFSLVEDLGTPPADHIVPLADGVAPARSATPLAAGVPIVLPDQPLHRDALVTLRGSAGRAAGFVPTDARIGISGLWWTYPEAAAHSTPLHAPRLGCLAAPLAFDHAQGGAVRLCTLGAPDATALAAPARRGEREVEILPWGALSPGGNEILELELPHSSEREFAISDGYTPPPDPGLPAAVRLRTPLAFPHRAGARVLRRSFTSAAHGALEREAQRGDRVLFLDTALAGDALLRLEAGSARDELAFARRLPTFDPGLEVAVAGDGAFEFPPLARVAQVRIRARYGTDPEIPVIDLALDYAGENPLRIQFP
jgi:hypothetical protein